MEKLEQLKQIINDGANALTRGKKSFVTAVADELGITYRIGRCNDCVIDLALKCYNELNAESAEHQAIRLVPNTRIIVNGTHINEAVCSTTEQCEWALGIGAPREYFIFDDESNE